MLAEFDSHCSISVAVWVGEPGVCKLRNDALKAVVDKRKKLHNHDYAEDGKKEETRNILAKCLQLSMARLQQLNEQEPEDVQTKDL